MSGNNNLNAAIKYKNDEFYTQLSDIENELKHYPKFLEGKTVLCNCDDPCVSNFFKYFSENFEKLKLKKLIITCYKDQQTHLFSQVKPKKAMKLEYYGAKVNNKVPDLDELNITYLESDGDFRNKECTDILKEVDIVVTNPPFSLFREFVMLMRKYGKKFLIIGNQNTIVNIQLFTLILNNELRYGYYAGHMSFKVPDQYTPGTSKYLGEGDGQKWGKIGTTCWLTNLDIIKNCIDWPCTKKYNPEEYPKYDNFDAINVDTLKDIPGDYNEIMGVPLTFLAKHNPKQFELIGLDLPKTKNMPPNDGRLVLDGKSMYSRILIRRTREIIPPQIIQPDPLANQELISQNFK